MIVATGLLIIMPVFSITLGNIAIGITYLRGSYRDRSKGIATIIALSVLFIASWTPLIVFTFFRIRDKPVSSALDLLAFHCIFLNTAGNPVLYTVTNRRFCRYVRSRARRVFCCCGAAGGDHEAVDNTVGATRVSVVESTLVISNKAAADPVDDPAL